MATLFHSLRQRIELGKLTALATVISGAGLGSKLLVDLDGTIQGTLGGSDIDIQVQQRALELMAAQRSERMTVGASKRLGIDVDEEVSEVFIDVFVPPPKLIVVGAVHIAIHLTTFASALGLQTVVVDARSAFATEERFPHVDRLIEQWPADLLTEIDIDESTCIVVLTHDAKLDDPALLVALNSPALYIGALGSKRTHAKRIVRLQEMGATQQQIARIHAPIGLDLGGRKPEEIAVAIIAEIVMVRNGRKVEKPTI